MHLKPSDIVALAGLAISALTAYRVKTRKRLIPVVIGVACVLFLAVSIFSSDEQTKGGDRFDKTATASGTNSLAAVESVVATGDKSTAIRAGTGAAVASGNDSTAIVGSPGATVNRGISEAAMLELLRDKSAAFNREFSAKYPEGYVLLSPVEGKTVHYPNYVHIKFLDSDLDKIAIRVDTKIGLAVVQFAPVTTLVTSSNSPLFMFNGVVLSQSYELNRPSHLPMSFGFSDGKTIEIYCEAVDLENRIFLLGFK